MWRACYLHERPVKFTFTVELTTSAGTDRDKVVVASSGSEVTWHIALKLLGYLLFFEERPRIEQGVGWHYKPDLVVTDATGRVQRWVDCGNIAVKKIDRVATWLGGQADFHILRRTRRETELLARLALDKIKRPERVQLVWFDDDVVDRLARLLDSSNRCTCERSADRLSLTIVNRHGTNRLETEGKAVSLADW